MLLIIASAKTPELTISLRLFIFCKGGRVTIKFVALIDKAQFPGVKRSTTGYREQSFQRKKEYALWFDAVELDNRRLCLTG